MKIKIAALALAFAAVLGSGCKKTTTTVTTPSLGGLWMSAQPQFVEYGEEQEFRVYIDDIYVSDNTDPGTMGVYWQVTGLQRDTTTRDVDKSNPPFYFTPEKQGTYTVTVNLFALNGKYYNATASVSFQAIDPYTAMDGMEGTTEVISFDDYEQEMFTAPIGEHTWMCQNLYTEEPVGRAYQDCDVVEGLFGQYYSWEEAQTICPDGWRLPTAAEFDEDLGTDAGDLMVKARFLDVEMWPYWPEVTITNETLFNAIPVGYMDLATSTQARGYKEYAAWWTSDTIKEGEDNLGVYRYIYCEEPEIKKGKGSKQSLALSVRCVKE